MKVPADGAVVTEQNFSDGVPPEAAPAGGEPADPPSGGSGGAPRGSRAGRDLSAAISVGVALGAIKIGRAHV